MSDEQKQFPFEPGEVVQMKSGGPMMTVEYVDEGMCGCVWFDTTWHEQRCDFRHVCLEARPDVANALRPASIWGGKVAARA